MEKYIKRTCRNCRKVFLAKLTCVKLKRAKFCSRPCKIKSQIGKKHSREHIKKFTASMSGKHPKGRLHGRWKGGRCKTYLGYIAVWEPNHPCQKRNYVKEHRLIMEKHLGRYLTEKEQVHHVNEIKDDNRIENFILFSSHGAHMRFHRNPALVKPTDIIFDGRLLERIKNI